MPLAYHHLPLSRGYRPCTNKRNTNYNQSLDELVILFSSPAMSTTTMSPMTVPYLSVPPTYNALDPFQRARLVQSSRKLGRVLGTTPILRDPSTSPSDRILLPIGPKPGSSGSRSSSPSSARSQLSQKLKSSRRQGSIFELPLLQNPAASQSTSSLSSMSSQASTQSLPESRSFAANRKRNIDVPSSLHLTTFVDTSTTAAAVKLDLYLPKADATNARMGMAPDALVRAHRRARSTSAASISYGVGDGTPLTPSFRLRAAANPIHRREVLHKLERTLGEPVPPSLVFPPATLARAAIATSDVPSSSDVDRGQLRPPSPDVQPRSPSLDLPREALYIAGPVRRASSTLTSTTRASRRRSNSIHGLPIRRNPRGSSHWQPPDEWEMGPSEEPDVKMGEGEGEFLGIWNAENYESVISRLRSLRA